MVEKRTTLVYNERTYPFYKTNRGQVDFENAGFTVAQVAQGNHTAMLALAYFHLRDCARRAGTPIADSFEQFIDNSEPEVLEVFARLNPKAPGKQEAPEPTKEEIPVPGE